jgi:hypothetical protein
MANYDTPLINKNSTVTLREVTREDFQEIRKLEVAPSQKKFVAPNAYSIAQAYSSARSPGSAPSTPMRRRSAL